MKIVIKTRIPDLISKVLRNFKTENTEIVILQKYPNNPKIVYNELC